jgi:hypothetical protein
MTWARLLVAMTFSCLWVNASFFSSSAVAVPNSYKQDTHGLEKQFEPFFKAYQKGTESTEADAFKVFQFPDAKAWFAQYFRPEDVEQLTWDAEAETEKEAKTLRMMMNIVARGGHFHAHCEAHSTAETGNLKERQNGVRPVKPVPVEQFKIKVQDEKTGKWFSWQGNFVYVDGAYRFAGGGAFPLWSMPDANDPNKK